MKTTIKMLVFVCFVVFICSVDITGETFPRMTVVKNAEAIVGMPWTPASAAGVARRTTRRVVGTTAVVAGTTAAAASAAAAAAAAQPSAPPPPTTVVVTAPPHAAPTAAAVPIGTVVQALPAGCTSVVVGGVSYFDCGGVFYKAAFQGNNLVYVVVEKPMK